MDAKKRVGAVLNREKVDRLPVDLWYTGEVGAALKAHTGVHTDLELYKALGLDKIVWVFMDYRATTGVTGAQAGAQSLGARNMWGVPIKPAHAGVAHYDEFGDAPLAGIEDPAALKDYAWWPDPMRFDYEDAVCRAREASKDFPVIGPWVSFFEIYCQLRGLEQSMEDMALNPDLVEAILDRIESIQTDLLERFLPQVRGSLDMVFVSDDIGGQTSLLISPAMWRQHLEPRMRRWCDLIHRHGLKVFYHTDGAAEPLIGPLIDCGIDVLNPIQHICPGMDPLSLKKKYGERVIFHGGVDNQKVLPFGTPGDVRDEVRMLLDTLGAGRAGFICSSCHNVQAGTPVENILAMIDTVHRYG